MKKKIFIIVVILIVMCLCTCAVVAKTTNLNFYQKDLTEQDIELKTKIAEISDTKADFRHNKQERIQNKTHDISFEKFNSTNSAVRLAIYTNAAGDEFEYDLKTGKLVQVEMDSNVVVKTDDSIDIDTAHKIALEYFPDDCDINDYKQLAYDEREKGYFFWYARYIGEYWTMDSFSMMVGYDGSIVSYKDTTDDINWKKLDIDEKYINAKIQEYAKKKGITQIKGDYVCIYKGKVCIYCTYGNEYESITNIPLE